MSTSMSPATQLFYGVRAAAPDTNPFVSIAYTLYQSLYSPMSDFYMNSITALHILYAIQTLILLAALFARIRRNRGDVWVFRKTSTARGDYITPHFAVAWQLSTLGFLILLQPYLVMTADHANGKDWPGYLGGRNMGFLPAWLSTWLALWSLTVAVCLPRSNGRRRNGALAFFSSPAFINTHFIGGIVLCCTSIMVPSIICSNYYDAGINHYRSARDVLVEYAPAFATMSSAQVEAALAEAIPLVDGMLGNLSIFPRSFGIAWTAWFAWIAYSYGVFLIVALRYFGVIRKSMKKLAGLDAKVSDRATLRKSFLFAVLTSVLITVVGLMYGSASLYVTVWTGESLTSKRALELETMGSLYGFAILGLFAACLSLAQSLVGSSASSNVHASSLGPSQSTKPGGLNTHVSVHVQTRTEVEVDRERDIVQLELADWKRAEDEKVRFAGEI